MPPLSSQSAGRDEVLEIHHHIVHLNADHHHKTLVESINSLLHVGNNGSHHLGSGNSYPTTEEEVSEDLLIILFTVLPLIAVLAVIFFIAVAIRKMRRAESLQEVPRRNEFKMSKIRKGLHSSFSNPLESFKKSKSNKKADPPSPLSLHEIRVVPAPNRNNSQNRVSLATQLSFESTVSSSSASSNGSQYHNATSPSSTFFSQVPPSHLYSTSFYRSQLHLNKLHKPTSPNMGGSLQSLGSMQSLSQYNYDINHSSSTGAISCGQQDGARMTMASSDTEPDNIDSSFDKKKRSSKKIKKVFQMMNIPKRIRQHQAEKNRFNIYTIPTETREQLKQIYVY